MKTPDKDIISTNQLIKVIRGDANSLSDEFTEEGKEQASHQAADKEKEVFLKKTTLILLFVLMILFTFLSIQYMSKEIKDIETLRDELIFVQKNRVSPVWSDAILDNLDNKDGFEIRINSLYHDLRDKNIYVSSFVKEISHILPPNCFLNQLNILIPSVKPYAKGAIISIEATLVDDHSFLNFDLANVIKSIEDSLLFDNVKIGYQNISNLFDYRTINFQMSFSLE